MENENIISGGESGALKAFVDQHWLILFAAWMIGMTVFLAPSLDLKIFGDDFNSWTKINEIKDQSASALFFERYDSSFYRPLEMMLVRANLRAYGYEPKLYHALTFIGHFLTCLLVLMLARRMGLDKFSSVVAAMLFSAHQAGAMAALSADSAGQVYSTAFGLLCLIALINKDKLPTQIGATFSSFFLFAALLSKDGAVSFFVMAIFVLAVHVKLKRMAWRKAAQLALPLIAVMIIYFILRARAHMAPPSFGDESRYQFWAGLNLFKNPALMLLAVFTPVGTHILAAHRHDFIFLTFVAHLLLVLAFAILGGLYSAYKKDSAHRYAVPILFGFLLIGLYPECLMLHVSELYAYKAMPFFCVLTGVALARIFLNALAKNKSFAAGFIALLFIAMLGLNLSGFRDKERLMRANGETAHNTLREIKTQVPKITKNTTALLADADDSFHYSVFICPGAYTLAVPQAFRMIYDIPVAGFEIVQAGKVGGTCKQTSGDCLAITFGNDRVKAEFITAQKK